MEKSFFHENEAGRFVMAFNWLEKRYTQLFVQAYNAGNVDERFKIDFLEFCEKARELVQTHEGSFSLPMIFEALPENKFSIFYQKLIRDEKRSTFSRQ